ncbi:MAG: adenylate cyclase [Nocardioidaceae bacterium]|nr:adenylate cyclase [Nocardioidaceae bacterium]
MDQGPAADAPVEPTEDAQELYQDLEKAILGSARTLNRVQVAERAGVPLERAMALWRALGFPSSGSDEEVLFVEADIEALRRVAWLVDSGFIDVGVELTLVRSMGRSFARLAEWEISELTAATLARKTAPGPDDLRELVDQLMPVVEDIHEYIWRRHIASAAGRSLLRAGSTGEGVEMAVGFADIVGFTRRSKAMTAGELAHLVEVFESTAASIVTEHGGRVIKSIGAEILFVADAPGAAGRIGLALVEAQQRDADFPDLRIGLAYGPVLPRLGDVFGPVVNIASRLTSVARRGRVLIDRDLHTLLKPREDEFRVRRGRTTTVRGYSRLDTWTLRRPRTG